MEDKEIKEIRNLLAEFELRFDAAYHKLKADMRQRIINGEEGLLTGKISFKSVQGRDLENNVYF